MEAITFEVLKKTIGLICAAIALWLDGMSYYRQIKKTVKMKKAAQVSSTAFIYKILKALCSMVGLSIYLNWLGFSMEFVMLLVYIYSLIVIMRYKPKGWKLFDYDLPDVPLIRLYKKRKARKERGRRKPS